MITDVGLDLDGVLFNFSSVAVDHFSKVLGRPLTFPTTWEFYTEPAWDITKAEFDLLLEEATVEHEIFDQGAPIAGTKEGWNALRELGLNIHIITSRSPGAMTQTTRWLERHNILPDSLHFAHNKAGVLDAVTQAKAVALDDHFDQCVNYRAYGITSFLFDQEWNKKFPARRVFSLAHFARYIAIHNDYWVLEDEFERMEEVF